MSTPSRQQGRTEITRARLIQSAEKIFARDGFEAAKLEEIAADAGYTRGAFYANFDSKEDLFFVMLEQEITMRITALEREMERYKDPQEKLRAMREFFLAKAADRRWCLLALEFKLFALRHPDVRRRLVAMHRRFIEPRVGYLEQVMQGLGAEMPTPAYAIGVSLAALGHALSLEHMLDPSFMREQDLKRLMTVYFDSLTTPREEKNAAR
jgi:AcrR family transcriptional regulator